MTKITQKQLIESLSQLKEIKPRNAWAVLLKSQILSEKQAEVITVGQPAKTVGIIDILLSTLFQKKMAYAFAVVLFMIVGVFGFARYTMPGDLLFPVKKIAEQSQAALTRQSEVKQKIATLSNRINDLAQVAKDGRKDNIPSAISEINTNASQLVKNLRNNPAQSSQTIKDIANSLKTLADVQGTDLTGNQDVKDLYKTVVQSQIDDLNNTTLTNNQKDNLIQAEDLYFQGKYTEALEKILLINI